MTKIQPSSRFVAQAFQDELRKALPGHVVLNPIKMSYRHTTPPSLVPHQDVHYRIKIRRPEQFFRRVVADITDTHAAEGGFKVAIQAKDLDLFSTVAPKVEEKLGVQVNLTERKTVWDWVKARI